MAKKNLKRAPSTRIKGSESDALRQLHKQITEEVSGKSRVQLYVDAADLAVIDSAAEAAGESRSEYMMKAALLRAQGANAEFTESQVEEIHRLVEEHYEEFKRLAVGVIERCVTPDALRDLDFDPHR